MSEETAAGGLDPPAVPRSDPPLYAATLRPNRSMGATGFAWVMAFTGGMLCLPLIPMAGSAAALGLAPFLAGALGALGWFLRRNWSDLTLREELRLWPDLVEVVRHEPRGRGPKRWTANPHWVELKLQPQGRPENYLTLRGGGREIELGAFLSPEERVELAAELETAFARARGARG